MPIIDKTTIKILMAMSVLPIMGINNVYANTSKVQQIAGVIIPETFGKALRDGMSIPLSIHLDSPQSSQSDQRIGSAAIWLDNQTLKIRHIQLEERDGNATLNASTRQKLAELDNAPFNSDSKIALADDAWLHFNFRELALQLVVRPEALDTLLRARGEDIGKSSAEGLSSTLGYNLGLYNNQMRDGGSHSSSYLSLSSVTALREHHLVLDGSFYGIGSSNSQNEFYKAMYERDFAGYRFAAGMLDTWNLQSLGPITSLSSGKIYGASWGNQANSTRVDNSHSVVPLIVFLPSAGEVHISRDGKLLSVQNFSMGSHEADSSALPYGIYDVTLDVVVNGRTVSSTIQRVNKLFSRDSRSGLPVSWQVWGGNMHLNSWSADDGKHLNAKETALLGVSASGGYLAMNWAASGYSYDSLTVAETQFSWPITERFSLGMQNMAASDNSWSSIGNLSTTLPGGFSSLWVSHEKTVIGDTLRRSDANNVALGGSLNLHSLWSRLGTLNASYNNDRRHGTHYYTVDYSQSLMSGRYGSLGLRTGVQRYNSGYKGANTGMEKYIAFDFSLPLGGWLRTGMTHQNGYTMANISAQKQFQEGPIRTIGANLSRAISGDTGDDKSLSGGLWTQYETRYSSGTLNVNSGADGHVNTNLTSNGSVGWQGKDFGLSGRSEGSAGVIFRTEVEDNGKLTAKVNGRPYALTGKKNYLPLEPYQRYEIEIQNHKDSVDSYDIAAGRKSRLTLYPGNVVTITPDVKQMVTVFGRIRAEDGSLLANARINNHIGRTQTDEHGEFVMDIDKKFPTIDFSYGNNQSCEVDLELSKARGAVWVGDVTCTGLKTYASTMPAGGNNES